jgi:hypothetical protein
MKSPAPPRRPRWRSILSLVAVTALGASLLALSAGAATAAVTQTWNLSGVTFDDGGTLTGSFDLDESGQVVGVNLTSSGGDTETYGDSTTYDQSNTDALQFFGVGDEFFLRRDGNRYLRLTVGDLSGAQPGDRVELSTASYECLNCSATRFITSGSIVNGPLQPAPAVTGTPTITSDGSGSAQVGQTLTGHDDDVTVTPDVAVKYYRWLRDGAAIPDATGTTYLLTDDDAAHAISFEVGASENGFADATPAVSDPVGPVDGGTITLPTPTITGTAVVDGTLSANLPAGLSPADADVTWHWFRGETEVGDSSSTYTPTASDVGHALTATATATHDHFVTTSESQDSDVVTEATFTSSVSASISGTVKVGQTLTANAGTVAPEPDQLTYQWYADGDEILGATGSTLVLGAAQRHTTISVQVTATKAGYEDSSDTSEETGDVATELAPDLSFSAEDGSIRLGESTFLAWSTTDADSVTASGAWTGSQSSSGSTLVSPGTLGDNVYVLEATNANGTTTSQVTVNVTRPSAQLTVSAPNGLFLAGRGVPVRSRGLDANEPYAIAIDGVQVATGEADATGTVTRRVTIPTSTVEHAATVSVTGSESDRTGSTTVRVVVRKTLGLHLAKHRMRTRHHQWITVDGLAAGEHVEVDYRAKRISPVGAHADSHGVYRVLLHVGRLPGTKAVTATGAFYGRHAATTFVVTRH